MEVTDELVQKIAHLARLEFHESDNEQIKKDLQQMLTFIEKLNSLDTEGVEPLLHISDTINVLREDKVEGMITRDLALMNAPMHDHEFFKVPKVINKL